MPFIVPASAKSAADEVLPFDVTLAVANTSEALFTVPVGKKLRGVAITNVGPGKAYFSFDAGAAATVADVGIEKNDSLGVEDLELAEGDYEFVSSALTRLRGFATVGA